MHTVNKAYAVLKQEGFVKLDRRKGAVVAIECDKCIAGNQLMQTLEIVLAEAMCKDISRNEVHDIVDKIYNIYQKKEYKE